MDKADKFSKIAADNGWTTEQTYSQDNEKTTVLATRDDESLEIWWYGNKLTESPIYQLMARQVLLRNASHAYRYLTGQPDYGKAARRTKRLQAATAAVQGLDGSPDADLPDALADPVGRLPFDKLLAEDRDILKACYTRTLVWKNSITQDLDEDRVIRGANWDKAKYHITHTNEGRRVLNFLGQYGFRSVYVDALLFVR